MKAPPGNEQRETFVDEKPARRAPSPEHTFKRRKPNDPTSLPILPAKMSVRINKHITWMSELKILKNSKNIIICFGGMRKLFAGVPPFEFLNYLSTVNSNSADLYFYIDMYQCWSYSHVMLGAWTQIKSPPANEQRETFVDEKPARRAPSPEHTFKRRKPNDAASPSAPSAAPASPSAPSALTGGLMSKKEIYKRG